MKFNTNTMDPYFDQKYDQHKAQGKEIQGLTEKYMKNTFSC